jgi:hypothetical protein
MMRDTPRWATLRTPPPLDVRQTLQSLPPGWAGLSYFWQEQPSGSVLHLFYAGRGDMPRHLSIAWLEGEVAALDEAHCSLRWMPTDELWSVEEILPSSLVPKVLPGDLCA